MRVRMPNGSVVEITAVPRDTLSRRQSKQRHGKIKWPSASTDTRDVIRSIYDDRIVERPKTRVVPDETGYRNGKPFVPIPTDRTYSFGRGGAGHMHRKGNT
jgi:hypothetical protein